MRNTMRKQHTISENKRKSKHVFKRRFNINPLLLHH
jgi:hypothetical protein